MNVYGATFRKLVRHRLPLLLLDTNTITFLADGHPTALQHLQSLSASEHLMTCFIVVGEWEYGIQNAPSQARQDKIRTNGKVIFAATSGIWDSTPEIATAYGSIQAELRKTGQMIPTNDIWIAATAQVYGATVITSDAHFRRVAGLKVVDWTQP